MTVRCVKCGYEMSTWQEVLSALEKFLRIIRPTPFVAGFLNTRPNPVRCPNCGAKGRWEDI